MHGHLYLATNRCASKNHSCDANAKCIPTVSACLIRLSLDTEREFLYSQLGGYTCQCEEGYIDVSASAKMPVGRICMLSKLGLQVSGLRIVGARIPESQDGRDGQESRAIKELSFQTPVAQAKSPI